MTENPYQDADILTANVRKLSDTWNEGYNEAIGDFITLYKLAAYTFIEDAEDLKKVSE